MNPATCSCESEKYLACIIDGSVITCDKIIDAKAKSNDEETTTIPTSFNETNMIYKTQNLYILLAFLRITIDSCYYLLLSDKISSKTKTFIIISHRK